MNGKIYKITNTITGESYIGQTVNSLEERFRHHKQGTRQPKYKMTKLQRAMEDYGKRNFTIELIEDGIEDIETLALFEKFYIQKYKTYNEYNSSKGGESKLRSLKSENQGEIPYGERIVSFKNEFNLCSFNLCTQKSLDFIIGLVTEISSKRSVTYCIPLEDFFWGADFCQTSKTESQLGSWANNIKNHLLTISCPRHLIDRNSSSLDCVETPFLNELNFNFESDEISFTINEKLLDMFIKKGRKGYTEFNFSDFLSLKKKYSKLLFRHLSQWKTHGECQFEIAEFRRLLDIPVSYKKSSKIRQVVIDPSIDDLKELFPDLKCESIIHKRKTVGYKFTWDAEYFKNKKFKEIADKQELKNRAKRKDVTPENKSVDELQDESQRMWEEKGLER